MKRGWRCGRCTATRSRRGGWEGAVVGYCGQGDGGGSRGRGGPASSQLPPPRSPNRLQRPQVLPVALAPGQPGLAPAPPAQGGEGWALPELAPRQRVVVRLRLMVPRRGSVDLRAALQYATAAACTGDGDSSGGDAGGSTGGGVSPSPRLEAGKSVAGVIIPVERPLRLDLQLMGPPRTHTLLGAAPASSLADPGAAVAAAGIAALALHGSASGSPGADPGGGAAPASSPPRASVAGQDPSGPMGAADSTDIAQLLERDLPTRYLLPSGQPCVATVVLQAAGAGAVEILGLELQPAAAPAAAAAAASQPSSALQVGAAAGAPAPGRLAVLGKGDTLTALLSLACPAPTELPSLGQLAIRWRRHGAPELQSRAMRGLTVVEGDDDAGCGEAVAAAGTSGGGCSGGGEHAPPVVETCVRLPAASFRPPLLTACADWPPSGSMGVPLPLTVTIENGSSSGGVEVGVAVGEPRGFLLAGPKADSLYLLPRSSITLAWEAVPYHPGLLPLPQARVCARALARLAVRLALGQAPRPNKTAHPPLGLPPCRSP